MKRKLIVPVVIAALLLLAFFMWTRWGANISTPEAPDATNSQAVVPGAGTRESAGSPESSAQPSKGAMPAEIPEGLRERVRREKAYVEQLHNQDHNVPVAFFGQVVDQNTNALANVTVDLAVVEELIQPFPSAPLQKRIHLQRQTGTDGRFEIAGPRGTAIEVSSLTKEGYEQDYPGRDYGGYQAQATSFINPAVLRMWSTNLHEQLITGEKSFGIIPDGRHYSIDLMRGSISEGNGGDLVAWVKRPEKVAPRERYSWSCELTVPVGGLLESQMREMFVAPESGYTNAFASEEPAGVEGWSDGTGSRRFYLRLRNGQIYGCATIELFAYYKSQTPGLIRLSYAVNPSGSRLLR